jgi:hypothetical protein
MHYEQGIHIETKKKMKTVEQILELLNAISPKCYDLSDISIISSDIKHQTLKDYFGICDIHANQEVRRGIYVYNLDENNGLKYDAVYKTPHCLIHYFSV